MEEPKKILIVIHGGDQPKAPGKNITFAGGVDTAFEKLNQVDGVIIVGFDIPYLARNPLITEHANTFKIVRRALELEKQYVILTKNMVSQFPFVREENYSKYLNTYLNNTIVLALIKNPEDTFTIALDCIRDLLSPED